MFGEPAEDPVHGVLEKSGKIRILGAHDPIETGMVDFPAKNAKPARKAFDPSTIPPRPVPPWGPAGSSIR